MSIPDFFRPHITFNRSITPIALDQLQQAIERLGVDATDPSAVGTSTEPNVRFYLLYFLRQVATYSESGTLRRTIGVIRLVPEFLLTFFMSRMRMTMRGARAERPGFAIRSNQFRAHDEASAGLPSS